jgi:hypothetical protein
MTTREHVKRRAAYVAVIVAAGFMGLSAGLVHASVGAWLGAMALASPIGYFANWVALRMSRCPRCAGKLGAAARAAVKDLPANCPSCDVSIDEACDSAGDIER